MGCAKLPTNSQVEGGKCSRSLARHLFCSIWEKSWNEISRAALELAQHAASALVMKLAGSLVTRSFLTTNESPQHSYVTSCDIMNCGPTLEVHPEEEDL